MFSVCHHSSLNHNYVESRCALITHPLVLLISKSIKLKYLMNIIEYISGLILRHQASHRSFKNSISVPIEYTCKLQRECLTRALKMVGQIPQATYL